MLLGDFLYVAICLSIQNSASDEFIEKVKAFY